MTMIPGNDQARATLQQLATQTTTFPFLLLAGPAGVGKILAAQELGTQLTGDFYHQDLLLVRDCSVQLGKLHRIKVTNHDTITREDSNHKKLTHSYEDIGAREMRDWLLLAPAGERKVMILQNIERMTPGAANALLKVLEEPASNRLIIATTSQPQQVLQTIRSRAVTIRFQTVDETTMHDFIQILAPAIDQSQQTALLTLAAGRPAYLQTLVAQEAKTQALLEDVHTSQQYYQEGAWIAHYKHLQGLHKKGKLDRRFATRLTRCDQYNDMHAITTTMTHQRMLASNVHKDTVLFSLARKLQKA